MIQADKNRFVERELNLTAFLQLLWKKVWFVVVCGVAAALVSLMISLFFVTPRYAARVTLYANNRYSSQGSTSISTSDMNASAQLVDVYAAIILSDPVLDQVIEKNHLSMPASTLAKAIAISSVNETEVFRITVASTNPQLAADVANSIAEIAPDQIAQIVDGCSIKLVSQAKVPTEQVSPNYLTSVEQGFMIGVVASVLLLLIVTLLDTRIKGEEDLRGWDFPIIGIVPAFEEAEKTDKYSYRGKGDES